MKKDSVISFKCAQDMRDIVERLAREGDRSVSMQMVKVLREWLEDHGHLKPEKPAKK
jgi:hypothetical protein